MIVVGSCRYIVRPSPFSAQKTFERHNSRRKSNISFCSQNLIQQMATNSQSGSRRGSAFGIPTFNPTSSPRAPPLATTKSNSLSLPDSPTVAGTFRSRSNSLRVDDILLRRSNSLRQGLVNAGINRRKSSLEETAFSHFSCTSSSVNHPNPIKIALNGSIGLEVTPPEEGSSPSVASNTALLVGSHPLSRIQSTIGIPQSEFSLENSTNVGQSGLNTNNSLSYADQQYDQREVVASTQATSSGTQNSVEHQHLQGTIV